MNGLRETGFAIFSDDREYRYELRRRVPCLMRWVRRVLWVMLNPSIADERRLDPTLRRCFEFTKSFGGSEMWIGNLFARVSTDPKGLHSAGDPIGNDNDAHLASMAQSADLIIVGWGAQSIARERARHVSSILRMNSKSGEIHCLGTTKSGAPKHPLYLSATTEIAVFCGGDAA